jgi:hypothetical protein
LPKLSCAAALLLLAGCQDGAETSGEAVRKGNAYLARNGHAEVNGIAVRMIDMGETWRLSYWDPEDDSVPAMIVVVNKKAGNVVHFEQRPMRKGAKAP